MKIDGFKINEMILKVSVSLSFNQLLCVEVEKKGAVSL